MSLYFNEEFLTEDDSVAKALKLTKITKRNYEKARKLHADVAGDLLAEWLRANT